MFVCRFQQMMNQPQTILLTGVTGFVGKAIAPYFVERGYRVIGVGRRNPEITGIEFVSISKIDRFTFWKSFLSGIDTVIHLAGRAHQMKETQDEQHLYYETNVEGSVNLAKQAVEAGVKKFVFISSLKAMISDAHEEALKENFVCCPVEPYGLSKLKAEIELRKISGSSGMKLVILRPPLMYGPGVKGNFASLVRLVRRLPFLPLGGLTNRRSLLGVMNLASAIETVITSEITDGKTYLVSDGEEISTSDLVARLVKIYNTDCRIFSLPAWLWKLAGNLPLLAPKVARLTGSLPVDSSLLTRETGWKAPFSMIEQL